MWWNPTHSYVWLYVKWECCNIILEIWYWTLIQGPLLNSYRYTCTSIIEKHQTYLYIGFPLPLSRIASSKLLFSSCGSLIWLCTECGCFSKCVSFTEEHVKVKKYEVIKFHFNFCAGNQPSLRVQCCAVPCHANDKWIAQLTWFWSHDLTTQVPNHWALLQHLVQTTEVLELKIPSAWW